MPQKIEQDIKRFRDIIRGRIKKELRKFISNSEVIGKKGKDLVSIPIPQIDIPHFIYGDKQKGGVGQGDGDVGQPLGKGEEEGGQSKAGNLPGEHLVEVEISFQELAEILGEELELPRIKPKGEEDITSNRVRYTSIGLAGPESLRHFKRTYRQALKRQIMFGNYDPKKPVIIPIREDRRYRMWKDERKPETKAVIIYMMDVSGSMGNDQKEIVRLEAFWIDTWLKSQYKNLEAKYIIHDAVAREVDRETFFHTRESGGTIISSAYKLCLKMLEEKYNPSLWNIYPFHFSDGDNWSGNDTDECIKLLKESLLPASNIFCYGQVESEYGSGQFLKDLHERVTDFDNLITSKIENKDAIVKSIKEFLGKGK
jgi:sporulation protein YhbH